MNCVHGRHLFRVSFLKRLIVIHLFWWCCGLSRGPASCAFIQEVAVTSLCLSEEPAGPGGQPLGFRVFRPLSTFSNPRLLKEVHPPPAHTNTANSLRRSLACGSRGPIFCSRDAISPFLKNVNHFKLISDGPRAAESYVKSCFE